MYCLPSTRVGHRRAALRRRHPHRADFAARCLVVGAQHRAARTLRRRGHLRIAHDDERLGHHQADADVPAWPVFGMFMPFSAGWLRTLSGVSPCGTCHMSSPRSRLIADSTPYGGLHDRQPLHGQAGRGRAGGAAPRRRRRRRRRRWLPARRARRIGGAAVAGPDHFAERPARRRPRRSGCPRTRPAARPAIARLTPTLPACAKTMCVSGS